MVDMLHPETGLSAVEILEHLGVEVDFPVGQTCCGQPAYNGGYRKQARQVAIQFLKVFKDAEVIVTPSGSCAAMIRHEYPALFAGDPKWQPLAEHAASITWELTEFIVDGLGIEDLKLKLPEPTTFAIHDSCHGLRMLGLGDAARKLVSGIENAAVHDLHDHDQCCGFGGLFAVKMADVSGAMLQKKIDNINACEAETILCGDVSCLSHMNGGLERQESSKRVRHIADVLAEGLRGKQQ
jgi:L-lactate dehydrogenase complex protein LldE